MKSLDLLFRFATAAALAGWSLLLLLPYWQHTGTLVLYVAEILLIALYAWLLRLSFRQRPEPGGDRPGFMTLRGVLALFKNSTSVLTAWIHILAFDLMVGLYIHNEAVARGVTHWLMVPCYLVTIMFGPLGLLLFLGVSRFA